MATREESKLLKEMDENFLICSICSERYKKAKILPCLHSFCEHCLRQLVNKTGKLNCPMCRRSHKVPDGGVVRLSNNRFITELVEFFEKRDGRESADDNKCDGCQRKESTKHCIECRFDLCDVCADAHTRLPCTRSHRVLELGAYRRRQTEDPASIQPPLHCDKHTVHPVTYYCDSCDQPICLECTILDHPRPEHTCRYLDDAAADYAQDLRKMLSTLAAKRKESKASKAAVQKVSEVLDVRFEGESAKLHAHAYRIVDKVTQLIRKNELKLVDELCNEYDRRKRSLNAQLKDITLKEADLENALKFAENLMQYGNAAQLMSAKKGTVTQIGELLRMKTKIEAKEDDYLEFRSVDNFCDGKALGQILKFTSPRSPSPPANALGWTEKRTDMLQSRGDRSLDVEISFHNKRKHKGKKCKS
ncbi:E3 ubiquitin-protein ligase TRIM56-like [Ptychodera flava]|uniref:E3 ubiquitin-protein ligase TRIM56-like n=1 Tax=Ptychodera flava TaxID=63121 RepID=UPI003969C3D7